MLKTNKFYKSSFSQRGNFINLKLPKEIGTYLKSKGKLKFICLNGTVQLIGDQPVVNIPVQTKEFLA